MDRKIRFSLKGSERISHKGFSHRITGKLQSIAQILLTLLIFILPVVFILALFYDLYLAFFLNIFFVGLILFLKCVTGKENTKMD